MKQRFFIILASILISLPVYAFDLERLENKALPELKLPEIQKHTFDNGLELYFVKNSELPLFELNGLIELRDIDDPDTKVGLSSIMLSLLRTGGTKKYSPSEFDEALDTIAATISISAGQEYSSFSLKSMSKDVDQALSLLFEMLRYPRFDPSRFEVLIKQSLQGIERRNESPASIARREFDQLFYGEKGIWARLSREDTIKSLTIKDLKKRHQELAPNKIRLAVSGDINFDELIEKLEYQSQGWQKSQSHLPELTELEKKWEPGNYLINKKSNQSAIVMGHFGERRFNEDKYALILANYIIGGSTFGARLGDRIRTELGLAYGIQSIFGLDKDYGLFRTAVETKSESTVQVIEEVKSIIQKAATTKLITQSELEDAKKTLLNYLIFQYEDPFDIVKAELRYDYLGYPDNYLQFFQKKIEAVSLEDVHEVLRKYFFADKMKVLIVGESSKINDLEKLNPKVLPLDNH